MDKEYNLSLLFEEEEFDVQKGYKRFGNKEAYFTVLYRFTLDSELLLRNCREEVSKSGRPNVQKLLRNADRLQGILANIGAINLAWRLQTLHGLLEKRQESEFIMKLCEILPDIEQFRQRIISAEKTEDSKELKAVSEKKEGESAGTAGGLAKLRLRDFKKLEMLIDNFEFESADKTADMIMQNSYTPEIDTALADIRRALSEFNYNKSLELAVNLSGLVALSSEKDSTADKKRILAIDDMPDVLRTVMAMLKDRYNIYGMTNYESAIKFLRSNTVDLILLDIEMPGLDGFAMMQLFRKIPEYAQTPIVFLTGSASDEHIKMAASLGAQDFIKKPVDLAVLVSKLEGALS